MQTNSTTEKQIRTKPRQPTKESLQRGKQWKRTDKRKLEELF